MQGTLFITGDPEADRLLNTEPLAILFGMLLDQQVQERTGREASSGSSDDEQSPGTQSMRGSADDSGRTSIDALMATVHRPMTPIREPAPVAVTRWSSSQGGSQGRLRSPPDVSGGAMGLRLKEFGLDAKVAGFGVGATWEPNDQERRAAWRLLLQLGTRTTVTPLQTDEGSLVAALASLHRMFEVTREILQDAGPDVAQDRDDGSPSLAALAVGILNDHLRPVLSKWHPLLDDRMATRPPDVGPNQWEAAWDSNEELREELNRLRQVLRNYLRLLGAAAGTQTFARVLTPE